MSDEQVSEIADVEEQDVVDEPAEDTSEEADDKPLGPAGEKAYFAEKERRRSAERERRALAKKNEAFIAEIAELKALAAKSGGGDGDEEIDLDAIRQEAAESAKAEAHAELMVERVSLKVEALAQKKKFADPEDALTHLKNTHELDDFLDDDGHVDAEAITEALNDLLERKPYLAAAQGGKRFGGSGDGGAKPSKPARPKSLGDAVTRHYTR